MMKDKGHSISITIGGRTPSPEEPMAEGLNKAEAKDEEMYSNMAPKGDFHQKALNALVSSANRLLPAFGQTPDYPMFTSDVKELPTDFVRILSMFCDASDDAVEGEIIDPELALSMDELTDDASLMALSGKLNALSASKDFKRFLKEPYSKSEGKEATAKAPPTAPKGEMSSEDMDKLFMEKM
jgi:hypothetical protein